MAPRRYSPHRPLSPAEIEKLQPRQHAYEVKDLAAKGLRLRVHPSGVKSYRWTVRDTPTSPQRVVSIGRFSLLARDGYVTQSAARDWVEKLRTALRAGQLAEVEAELRAAVDPPPPAPPPAPGSPLLSEVADDFMKRRIEPHRKRPEDARKALARDILPLLGARPVTSITTPDCARVVEAKVDDGSPGGAGKVLGLLKQLLSFAESRGLIDRNPAARLDPDDLGVVRGRRKRWLSAEELPLFWDALGSQARRVEVTRVDYRSKKARTFTQEVPALEESTRAGLKLLLLTGVRTGELLRARWTEVDFDATDKRGKRKPEAERRPTWTIPVANQKLTKKQALDARPFVVPLSPAAVDLMAQLRAAAGTSPWVMASPTPPAKPEDEPSPYEEKSLGHAMRRLFGGTDPKKQRAVVQLPGGPVSPHDLRRSMRTHLAKLRVPPHITERCLNHSLGRIVQTYDLHDYLDERREALERWDAYLHRLVTGEGAEVVAIPAAGGRS